MNEPLSQDNLHATDQVHPLVYKGLAALAIGLVVAAWILFSKSGYIELDLGMVSVLVFMLIAIPSALLSIGRTSRPSGRARSGGRGFRDWLSGDFDMRQGRRKGFGAAIEILLPMTAAVVGMTAIGIVFDLTATGSHLL